MFIKLFRYGLFALISTCAALLGGPAQAQILTVNDLYILGGGGGGGGSDGGGGGGAGGYIGDTAQASIAGGKGFNGAFGGSGGGSNGLDGSSLAGGAGGTGVGGAGDGTVGQPITAGGDGGAGGSATKILTADATYRTINIYAGGGGYSSDTSDGGNGGNAALRAENATITLTESLTMRSASGAGGGAATFVARNLTLIQDSAPVSLTFLQGSDGGEITVRIDQLDARQAEVELVLNLTTAGDGTDIAGVWFGEIILGGGKTFTINYNDGVFNFGALTVEGSAHLISSSLNAANKQLNFIITDDVDLDASSPMLDAELALTVTNATVGIQLARPITDFAKDDVITLIDTTGGSITGTVANNNQSVIAMQGISKGIDFLISSETNEVNATVQGILDQNNNDQIADQLAALSESRLASLMFLNQDFELLQTQGFATQAGPLAFAAVNGSWLKHDSDFELKVDGVSMMAGLGWNLLPNSNSRLLLGAFFEAGWGNYDTANTLVATDGKTRYYGGGLLARYDTARVGHGNFYLTGAFKAGRLETDFHSTSFIGSDGNLVEFDSKSPYYGAQLGLGYLWSLSETSSLDLYTSYYWMHLGSDDLIIHGDLVEFDNLNSHRWRAGLRFNHLIPSTSGPVVGLYLGAAYEHEFSAVEHTRVDGQAVQERDLKGGTGIAELGLNLKPSANSGFSVDLSAQGYLGQRQGLGGTLRLQYAF